MLLGMFLFMFPGILRTKVSILILEYFLASYNSSAAIQSKCVVNRLTAIDANWCQIRRTLKRHGRQMASWMPHLTLMLISREGYQLGP